LIFVKYINCKTFKLAIKNNHLECLKNLHKNGHSWDEKTCSLAAKNGQLECLKYAHENGCPWNKEECLKLTKETSIKNYIKNLLKNEKKDQFFDEISLTCNNCSINKKCTVYKPCGHLSSCWSCAVEMKNCPHCHKEISDLLKIFFP
jgi:hypothetical protein